MNVFFLASQPESLEGNYAHLATDDTGAVFNLDAGHPVNRYQATSDIAQPGAADLRGADGSYPADVTFQSTSPCPRWTVAFRGLRNRSQLRRATTTTRLWPWRTIFAPTSRTRCNCRERCRTIPWPISFLSERRDTANTLRRRWR